MNPPVIFLHVPKAAGTTLRSVIRRRYPDAFELEGGEDWAAAFQHADTLPRVDAYMGHMPYGLHRALGVEARYVTILREPVARALSAFNHVRSTADHRSHVGTLQAVEEWAASSEANVMTRLLAGPDAVRSDASDADDGTMLDEALEHAAQMTVIGLQHRFEASLALISQRLGWGTPRYRNRRVAEPYPAPGPEVVEILHERNRLDLALYQELEPRCRAELEGVGRRTMLLRARNPRVLDRAEDAARRLLRRG